MVQIRSGQPADLGWLVQQVALGAWAHLAPRERAVAHFATTRERVEAMVQAALAQPGSGLVVAEEDGRIKGHGLYYLQPNPFTGAPEGLLADLQVAEGARGQGVALRLLQAAEERLQQAGARGCNAVVPLHQPPALRLFTAAGYWPERVLVFRPFR